MNVDRVIATAAAPTRDPPDVAKTACQLQDCLCALPADPAGPVRPLNAWSANLPMRMKMHPPFVSLCPEITRSDALNLIDWLQDECVTRYLSDSRHVSRFIEQVIGRVQLPILTHLFNQGGRFLMVCDAHDVPVGFVRLVKTGPVCEMVLVIGNRDNWGRQFGASAVHEAMKFSFFEMRAERLIAKVHPDNTRSLKMFERSGFLLESQTPALQSFAMTSERYLRLLRKSPAGHADHIHITETEQARLRNLLAFGQASASFELEHEIERAIVVDSRKMPRNVVTMNSRAMRSK